MHVTSQHDRVGDARLLHRVEEPLAGSGVGVPVVGAIAQFAAAPLQQVRDHRALRKESPAAARGLQPLREPAFLRGTQHGVGVVGPELPLVEQADRGQVTAQGLPVDGQAVATGRARRRQRHVLEVGPVGGRATREEDRRIVLIGCGQARVVVGDFMVIPSGHPRTGRMRRLQRGIGLVQRIAGAVVVEAADFVGVVRADGIGVDAVFVDVVAQVQDQVRCIGSDMAVGSVMPLLVVLAAGHCQVQGANRGAVGGQRARARGRTAMSGRGKAIPVVALWLQATRRHMHAVRPFWIGVGGAAGDDARHGCISGHFPVHRIAVRRHAALRGQGVGCQAGPQHHRIGRRIAGRHAETKRVFGQGRCGSPRPT